MNEIFGYIFNNLGKSEKAIELICEILNKQNKINKHFTTFMMLTAVYMCVDIYGYKKQEEKIEALSKEIEELKSMKGE